MSRELFSDICWLIVFAGLVQCASATCQDFCRAMIRGDQ